MKKFIIFIITFLCVCIAIATLINVFILPGIIKKAVSEKGESFLGRTISYNTISYQFGAGLIITDLNIKTQDDPTVDLFSVHKITCRVPILTILKKRKLFLTSIELQSPKINLTRYPQGTFTISDILEKMRTQKKNSDSSPLFLGKVIIKNGEFFFNDQTINESISLESINADIGFQLPDKISARLTAGISKAPGEIKISGDYHLKNAFVNAQISAQELSGLQRFLPAITKLFQADELSLHTMDITLKHSPSKTSVSGDIAGRFSGPLAGLTLSTDASLEGLNLELTQGTLSLLTQKASATTQIQKDLFTFSSVIGAQHLSINKAKGDWDLSGMLNLTDTTTSAHGLAFQSSKIDIAGLNLSSDEDSITAEGKLSSQDMVLKGFDSEIHSDITTQRLNLSWSEKELTASLPASLTIKKITTPQGISADGVFTLNRLTLKHLTHTYQNEEDDEGTFEEKEFLIESEWETHAVNVDLPQNITFSGNPKGSLTFNLAPDNEGVPKPHYTGSLIFNNASVKTGVENLKTIDHISGIFNIDDTIFKTDKLSLTARNTDIILDGKIQLFPRPSASISLSSENINTADWAVFLAPQLTKLGLEVNGEAALKSSYRGGFTDFSMDDVYLNADIKHADITWKKLGDPITNINGKIQYQNRFLTWDGLSADFQGIAYTSTGSVKNFSQPVASVQIANDTWNMRANLKTTGNIYDISPFKATTQGSSIIAEGSLQPDNDDLIAQIKANVQITSDDIMALHPTIKNILLPYSPKGNLTIQSYYSGPIKNWPLAAFSLQTQSRGFSVKGIRLDNFAATLQQSQEGTNELSLDTNFYNGTVSIQSEMYPRQPKQPLRLNTDIQGVDLASVIKAVVPDSTQELSGNLYSKTYLKGSFEDILNLTGQGDISIRNGYLWKANFLKGPFSAVLLIPEYQDIVFTDLYANFRLEDQKVSTKNLTLKGNFANLIGEGWIGFDQKMHFDFLPEFKESEIIRSESFKKNSTQFLTQAQGYLSVSVDGTVSKPVINVKKDASKLLQKTADTLIDGVGSLIEDIFQ